MTAAETAGAIALLGREVPLVTTRHFGQARGSHRVVRLASRWVGGRIDAQIAVSQWVADRVEGDSVVIHPGAPVLPAPAPLESRDRVILVAQRLEAEKQTVLALRPLPSRGWPTRLASRDRGHWSLRTALQSRAAQLGLVPATRFLGHRADVLGRMGRSRMLLATAPAEHFGLTVLEAMACGLPVVAARAAGHLETLGAVRARLLHARKRGRGRCPAAWPRR